MSAEPVEPFHPPHNTRPRTGKYKWELHAQAPNQLFKNVVSRELSSASRARSARHPQDRPKLPPFPYPRSPHERYKVRLRGSKLGSLNGTAYTSNHQNKTPADGKHPGDLKYLENVEEENGNECPSFIMNRFSLSCSNKLLDSASLETIPSSVKLPQAYPLYDKNLRTAVKDFSKLVDKIHNESAPTCVEDLKCILNRKLNLYQRQGLPPTPDKPPSRAQTGLLATPRQVSLQKQMNLEAEKGESKEAKEGQGGSERYEMKKPTQTIHPADGLRLISPVTHSSFAFSSSTSSLRKRGSASRFGGKKKTLDDDGRRVESSSFSSAAVLLALLKKLRERYIIVNALYDRLHARKRTLRCREEAFIRQLKTILWGSAGGGPCGEATASDDANAKGGKKETAIEADQKDPHRCTPAGDDPAGEEEKHVMTAISSSFLPNLSLQTHKMSPFSLKGELRSSTGTHASFLLHADRDRDPGAEDKTHGRSEPSTSTQTPGTASPGPEDGMRASEKVLRWVRRQSAASSRENSRSRSSESGRGEGEPVGEGGRRETSGRARAMELADVVHHLHDLLEATSLLVINAGREKFVPLGCLILHPSTKAPESPPFHPPGASFSRPRISNDSIDKKDGGAEGGDCESLFRQILNVPNQTKAYFQRDYPEKLWKLMEGQGGVAKTSDKRNLIGRGREIDEDLDVVLKRLVDDYYTRMAKQAQQREVYREEFCLTYRMKLGIMGWPPVNLKSTPKPTAVDRGKTDDRDNGTTTHPTDLKNEGKVITKLRMALLAKEQIRREVSFWLKANYREEQCTRSLEAKLRSIPHFSINQSNRTPIEEKKGDHRENAIEVWPWRPADKTIASGPPGSADTPPPCEGEMPNVERKGPRVLTMEDWADIFDARQARGLPLRENKAADDVEGAGIRLREPASGTPTPPFSSAGFASGKGKSRSAGGGGPPGNFEGRVSSAPIRVAQAAGQPKGRPLSAQSSMIKVEYDRFNPSPLVRSCFTRI